MTRHPWLPTAGSTHTDEVESRIDELARTSAGQPGWMETSDRPCALVPQQGHSALVPTGPPAPYGGAISAAPLFSPEHALAQEARKPWLALLFSLPMPGLGQMYNGQIAQGLAFWVLWLAAWPLQIGWIIHFAAAFAAVRTAEEDTKARREGLTELIETSAGGQPRVPAAEAGSRVPRERSIR